MWGEIYQKIGREDKVRSPKENSGTHFNPRNMKNPKGPKFPKYGAPSNKLPRLLHPVNLIAVYGYAFLYLYTGSDKLANLEKFTGVLNDIPGVEGSASVLAWAIPVAELVLGTCLVFSQGTLRRRSLRVSVWLMGIFTAYLASVLLFGLEGRFCSCGGVIGTLGWRSHLLFNIIFLAVGLLALKWTKITDT